MSDPDLEPTRPVHAIISQLHADQDHPDRALHPPRRRRPARSSRALRPAPRSGQRRQVRSARCLTPTRFRSRWDRKTKTWVDTSRAFAGVLRLAQGHCTRKVVAHEAAHAALHVIRLHDWAQPDGVGIVNLDDTCGPAEENFCYLHGSLLQELERLADDAHRRMGRARP